MSCTTCGRANRPGARFGGSCGRPLAPRCPACGTECEPGAQFCDACGASLVTSASEQAVARKVVTIVFADLIGSTALHERLDPESVGRLMDRYYEVVRQPVEAHGGSVVQLLGEVVVSDEHRAGLGDPLNVAARLQQEAHDGDVLISESTQRLVSALVTLAPFGVFSLKGRSETVAAYRVVSLERPAGAPATAFVGREGELRRIMAGYHAAGAAPPGRLGRVPGPPGPREARADPQPAPPRPEGGTPGP